MSSLFNIERWDESLSNWMLNLQEAVLSTVSEVIVPGSDAIYIDYPLHNNIGDQFIMHGTMSFFEKAKVNILYKANALSYDFELAKSLMSSDAVVVCHGGGNFGDIYSLHQEFRLDVAQQFPKHKVVFLPQTVHYSNEKKMHDDIGILNKHKDLYVFVRDVNSYNSLVSNGLRNVRLCPDMAHMLWKNDLQPMSSKGESSRYASVAILRKDVESASQRLLSNQVVTHKIDWDDTYTVFELKLLMKLFRFLSRRKLESYVSFFWLAYCSFLKKRIEKLYMSTDVIETDRLHGYIIAILNQKPVCLSDNSYGKNSRYIDFISRYYKSSIG